MTAAGPPVGSGGLVGLSQLTSPGLVSYRPSTMVEDGGEFQGREECPIVPSGPEVSRIYITPGGRTWNSKIWKVPNTRSLSWKDNTQRISDGREPWRMIVKVFMHHVPKYIFFFILSSGDKWTISCPPELLFILLFSWKGRTTMMLSILESMIGT